MPQFLSIAQTRPSSSATNSDAALTLLGPSSAMAQLWSQMRRLAPHVRTLLLVAEADCGQGAVARLLFDLVPHQRRPFLEWSAQDAERCLLRSAGAAPLPPDVFLYLPEVERMSLAAQGALLRLLRMRRPGSFTVVASATANLGSLASVGRFLPELAEQLCAVCLEVPCLRERVEDIPLLISHMLPSGGMGQSEAQPQVAEEFLRAAMGYAWPGNLRQLQAVLSSLSAAAEGEPLQAKDLERALATHQEPAPETAASTRLVPLDTVVQEHIFAVLGACRGNKLRAAEVLGISRSTLYRMLDTATVHAVTLPPRVSRAQVVG